MMWRFKVGLGVVVSAFVVVFVVVSAHSQMTLPSAPLRLFDGGNLDLRTLKGQIVVIRFLASW